MQMMVGAEFAHRGNILLHDERQRGIWHPFGDPFDGDAGEHFV
jgi:hypothetical protein